MAGESGVERVEHARRAPGVRLLVVDGTELLLVPDGPQGPGAPTWRLPGGAAFDSYPAYAAVRHDETDVPGAVDDAADRVLREAVGLEPVDPERRFVLGAGPGVEFDCYYYLVERYRPAPRDGDPADATWVALDDAREAALDGRIAEGRSALALLRWLAED
jgi:ADP-ribose pyrophosphatase YjhB (NUDIX family)